MTYHKNDIKYKQVYFGNANPCTTHYGDVSQLLKSVLYNGELMLKRIFACKDMQRRYVEMAARNILQVILVILLNIMLSQNGCSNAMQKQFSIGIKYWEHYLQFQANLFHMLFKQ